MRKIERFDKYMNINKLNDNQVTVNCGLSERLGEVIAIWVIKLLKKY